MLKNIESELVIDIIEFHSKIQKHIGHSLSVHGLGLSEYLVLHQLYSDRNQKLHRSKLAERVGLSPSGITRLLNPMEKMGLVEKEENPRDARVSLVTLSVSGKTIYEDAKISFTHESENLFNSFNSKQLSEFSKLFNIIL